MYLKMANSPKKQWLILLKNGQFCRIGKRNRPHQNRQYKRYNHYRNFPNFLRFYHIVHFGSGSYLNMHNWFHFWALRLTQTEKASSGIDFNLPIFCNLNQSSVHVSLWSDKWWTNSWPEQEKWFYGQIAGLAIICMPVGIQIIFLLPTITVWHLCLI